MNEQRSDVCGPMRCLLAPACMPAVGFRGGGRETGVGGWGGGGGAAGQYLHMDAIN